ncbi:hypothetical protein [Streptomyces sp. Ag109_G2-15]|uniref:hypothetical protein n=1 Tax=Streptomyces sp. Ag109_G2-15 TaxID=1938850 RepID=UPI000BC4D9F2|nr:hypothetical protein [Streptomyces sp. Ag109_G2-15]SOD89503.1 GTP cyclohydrolase II [Streptomyces sp. Ag109_G2-15]
MRDSRNATASSDSRNPTGLSAATVRSRVTVPLRFGDGYTVTADLATFHHLADGQEHVAAAQMLRALGITELDLLSSNPDKAAQLRTLGLAVTQHVPTGVFTTAHNIRYLGARVVRTQHTLPLTELTAG